MAKKKYKLSELGELGELVKNYKEKNSKKKETDSNNALDALSNSSSVQRYHNLGESLNNYLQKSSGVISKNDYVNALNAQRKAIGAAVKSAVNSATSSRLPSEINDSERNAIAEATKIARFKESEKEEADKRAARQKSIENAKQNHPVVTDINPVSDWLNYIFDSEQNYGRGGIENAAYSVNAFGAGTLEAIKNAAKAISGDKEAQDIIKNDAKYTKDKIVAAFEKNRENPYGKPDEQLQEGEHLENLKKVWNKINPISNAAKAASVFNSTPYNKGFAEYKNTHTPEYQKDVIQKEIERAHPIQSAKPQYSPTQIIKGLLTNTAYNMPAIAVSVASRGTAAAPYANYISGATLGIQSMSDSYDEAKKEGATDEEAVQYAMLEGVNQGVMDTVLGGVSGATGGFLDKPISNLASHIVKTPLAKTMVETGLDMLEEGMQESAQNYITTINKRVTYNPDAEFDVEGAVYEGVLGGLNSLVLSPGKAYSRYQVNRAAYDTVNSLSTAASKVSSEQDAKIITDIADQISKGADEVIADSETETADKANAEYIKRGVEAVKNILSKSSPNIIKNNRAVSEKTLEIIRLEKSNNIESLTELVKAVIKSGYSEKNKNAVNNTVDYVNELIRNWNKAVKEANKTVKAKDSKISKDQQTAKTQKQKAQQTLELANSIIPQLKSISENLRSQRAEIDARLKIDENIESSAAANQTAKTETAKTSESSTSSNPQTQAPTLDSVSDAIIKGSEEEAISKMTSYVEEQAKQTSDSSETIADSLMNSLVSKYDELSSSGNAETAAEFTEKAGELYNQISENINQIVENARQTANTSQNTEQILRGTSSKTEAQQAQTNTTERVSNSAYHSETAENIRSTYEGRNIKETAENIIKAHGNVRSAVDYVHDVYAKSGGSNADASTKEYIRALDSEIRKANKPLLEKNIKRIETLLKEYGVKNVEIDESITPLTDDGKSVWGMAHYNRGTGRIYVSPYADGKAIIGSKIVHEFTHHAAKADNSLVGDILKAARESKVFNKEIKLADGTTTTTVDNLTRLVKENYTDEINEYIATSTNLSRYKVLVGMGKSEADAAKIVADEFKASHAEEYNNIVDEYVSEDTAAYVMEFLNQEKNEDILSQLIKDNRPLWKRILDKIEDFIAKITGKTEAREYQKAADKIREILGNEIDAKVENTGSFKAIQQQIKNGNEADRLKVLNTLSDVRFSKQLDTENDTPVAQSISSWKTSIKQVPALFRNPNVKFGETNIDIGGGRFDLATDFLRENGTKNMLFDPYNRSEEVNKATLDYLRDGNRADTATCANVLNVIKEADARANVILETAKSIKQDGTAYFMVYEGDGSGTGKETSSGWQNNKKTADYVSEIEQYFNIVDRKGKLITATDPKENLPKAAWELSPGNAIRYSKQLNSNDFTYDALVSKPAMKIIDIKSSVDTNTTRADIIEKALENAKKHSVDSKSESGIYVKNSDSGTDILVGKNGLSHGLHRNYFKNAELTSHVGDFLENAILINRHNAREQGKKGSIYLGLLRDGENLYIGRAITNDSNVLEDVEALYALSNKKESVAHNRLDSGDNLRLDTDSEISIADFLNIVKDKYADVLPKNVLDNLNMERPNSSVSDSVRYSKELITAEEKKKVREAERAAYLERQLVSTAPLGGKAKAVSPTAKAAVAKKIASGMPGVSTAQVNEQLTKFFEVIEHPKATTPAAYRDEVRQMANVTAQNLYNEFRIENTNPLYDEFNDAYNHIKSLKFKMTDAVKDDFGKEAYSDFYKRARGTLKLRVNDGMAVDELWGELCYLYPYFFNESTTNPSEMMEQIYEVQSSLKKTPGHPYYDMSSENTDIFSEGEDTATVNSIADALVAAYLENAKPTVAAENKSLRNENKRLAEEANAARGEAADAKTTLKVTMDWNQAELTKMYGDFTRQISEEQKQLQQANRKIERLTNKVERKNVNMAQKTALKEIGRLHEMFTNPTKQKHIPQNLRAAVGSYLASLNNTKLLNGKTVNSQEITETLQSEQERINSAASKVINTLSGKFTTDSELYQGRSTRQIEALKFELDKLTELANESPNSGIDSSNNADYIRTVTDLTRMVNYLVKQSNDFFTGTRKVEAETFAKSWIDELSGHKTRIGETGFERSQFKKLLDGVGYSFMSADLFFSTMGEPGKEISSWYRNAQTRQVKMKQEYGEYMSGLLGDNYSTISGSTQAKKNLIDVKIHGNDVKVSKNQLMSLYLTWKRAAGRRHLENGGAAFANANNETSKVYVIDEATYNTLMEKLTADDKRIADGIGKFLSENCSEWGNEASMQLYGIRLYEDSNYFPIRTPSELRDTNFSNLADTHTIENSSFTHKLNKNANAAVVIGDVFDIADRHVNDMSAYSAYAPLNNSMERAFNANGLKRALSSAYGNNGVKYMQDFIDKINGNEPKRTTGENANKVLNFISNNAKKAAVSANISTALKQPLSLVRSWLVIDPKYTLAAYAQITPGVNNIVKQGKEYNRILNTMNEYSGIAVIKSLGYSDTGIGTTTRETYDEQSLKSAYKKTKYIQQSAEDIAMRPAEFADEITWVRMWKACELEAKAKYGNTLSTDEFNRRVADKFNEIIGKTQVVDSVLDTAPISTDRFFKTLFPFMNEPVKTAATLISAAENVRNGKAGAKKQLTNAIGCYVISNLLLEPIVSSLIGMWRHDSPKDPEDFAKKFLERFIGIQADGETKWTDIFSSNVADGLFAVPYIAQIYDTIANKFNNFDPERMDLQPVADLVGNGMYFFNSLSKEDYENQKTKANYAADMIASLAQILGIPGSTLKRDLSAIARTAVDATGAYVAQWELNKVYYNLGNANARTNKNFYDIMAKAYNAGDTEAYSYMLRDLRSIQTGAKAFGVPYSNINKYITEHGAKIVEGTDMWYVSLQAEYDLNTFVPNMKVEKLVTSVYQKAKNEKLDNYENAIYKAPTTKANATFSVNKEDYEMTLEEFDDYIRNTGDFAYKITNYLPSNYKWSSLSTAQQLYALEKTYEFSKAYWKKKLKPEYSAKSNWMDELCDNKVDFQTYARVIINQAENYSPKD